MCVWGCGGWRAAACWCRCRGRDCLLCACHCVHLAESAARASLCAAGIARSTGCGRTWSAETPQPPAASIQQPDSRSWSGRQYVVAQRACVTCSCGKIKPQMQCRQKILGSAEQHAYSALALPSLISSLLKTAARRFATFAFLIHQRAFSWRHLLPTTAAAHPILLLFPPPSAAAQ